MKMMKINPQLRLSEVDVPQLKSGQALVKVVCLGITEDDVSVYKANASPNFLGTEFSGIVRLINHDGDKTSWLKEGDRVLGFTVRGGAMAEYVCCDVRTLALIPAGISFVQAASVPDMWFSAVQILKEYIDFQKRDRIVVFNAMGSRGQAVVKLSQVLGCRRVHCVVKSDTALTEAKTHLRLLGALPDEVVVLKEDNTLLKCVSKYDPDGVEKTVYLDSHPCQVYPEMSTLGATIAIAPVCYQSPDKQKGSLLSPEKYELFTLKSLRLVGCNVRGLGPETLVKDRDFIVTHVLPNIRNKQLSISIEKVFGWENVADALLYMQTHPESKGKVVCVVDHSEF